MKKWSETDLVFTKNRMFIDELGFNINMKPSRVWSPRGKKTKVETLVIRASSHSILGCISTHDVVKISIRVPKALPKIRKIQIGRKRKAMSVSTSKEKSKGATSGHYLKFTKETLDITDKHEEMRGSYLNTDNALIHTGPEIEEKLKSRNRGYKCVYHPPYSPELNLFEQFCTIVEKNSKRYKLIDTEMLEDRITDTRKKVPIDHLYSINQQSKKTL